MTSKDEGRASCHECERTVKPHQRRGPHHVLHHDSERDPLPDVEERLGADVGHY